MRIAPKINEITGRRDGIFYSFGNTDVSLILAEKLLALPDNQRKFHAVCSKLSDYTNGLRTLASLPKKAPMRGMMCLIGGLILIVWQSVRFFIPRRR